SFSSDLLRSHVRPRTACPRIHGERRVDQATKAQINDDGVAPNAIAQDDVRRFDIAVHDINGMKVSGRLKTPQNKTTQFDVGRSTIAQGSSNVFSRDELADQIGVCLAANLRLAALRDLHHTVRLDTLKRVNLPLEPSGLVLADDDLDGDALSLPC